MIRYCLIFFLIAFLYEFPAFTFETSTFSYNSDAQEQYYFALGYFRHGEYEQALEEAYKVVEIYPNTEAALKAKFLVGEVLLKTNRKDEALKVFEEIEKVFSENFEILEKIGDIYKESQDYEAAITIYERAFQLADEKIVKANIKFKLISVGQILADRDFNEGVRARMNSPENYDKYNKYFKRAAELYEDVIYWEGKIDPIRYYHKLSMLGQSYIELKDYEKAAEVLEEYQKWAIESGKKENIYAAHSTLFRAYLGTEKFDKILDLYLKGQDMIFPERDLAWNMVGYARDEGKLSRLLAALEEKIKYNENDPFLLYALSVAYDISKDKERAIMFCTKALELRPNTEKFYQYLGTLYQQIGKYDEAISYYDEAISYYEKAIELAEDDATFLKLSLGECYHRIGDFMQAENLYKEVMEKGEKFPSLARRAEFLLLELCEIPEILDKLINEYEAILRKYGELNKDEKEQEKERTIKAGLFLSKIYVKNNMLNKRLKVLDGLLRIDPQRSDIYDKIGDIYFYNVPKGTKESIKWYKKAIQKNQNDDHATLRLGYAYERKEMYEKAAKQYTILAYKYKDHKDYDNIFWLGCSKSRLNSLKLIKEKQLIKDWLVIGPFDNSKGEGFNTIYPPEKEIDLTRLYVGKDRKRIKWFRPYKNKFGYVDLDEVIFPNEDAVAYALIYIESPAERKVQFKVGSDDSITIWLNDERILSRNMYRSAKIDQDKVDVKLQRGRNKILVKVCEGPIDWGFYFRVTDLNGEPVNGLRYSVSQ